MQPRHGCPAAVVPFFSSQTDLGRAHGGVWGYACYTASFQFTVRDLHESV